MQDRYAGNVGDFGKYALLNHLCIANGREQTELTLGVLWYVPWCRCVGVAPVPKAAAGTFAYLEPEKCRQFRQCAPDLWEKMRSLGDGRRSIAVVESIGALPAGTKYYSEPQVCERDGSHATKASKKERRRTWLRAGQEAVKGVDVVFVDPDRGFRPEGREPHHKEGPMYVHYCDLDAHVSAGQSIVVYHHLSRRKGKRHPTQIKDLLATVSERYDLEDRAFALRYKGGRAYFILPNSVHSELLTERAEQLIESCWGKNEHLDRCIYRPSSDNKQISPAAGSKQRPPLSSVVHSYCLTDENENVARLRRAGMKVVFGGPENEPCDLLPPSAFPGPPDVRPIPALRRQAGIDDSETGPNSRTVRWRFFSSCAGWPRPPTPAEFHEALRATTPDRRQRVVLRTWFTEATNREITRAWIEEAYTWPMLVAAIHRVGYHRNALNYYLNGFARRRRGTDSASHR